MNHLNDLVLFPQAISRQVQGFGPFLAQFARDYPCSGPVDAAAVYLASQKGVEVMAASWLAPTVAAGYLWRKTPAIYRFDPTFGASLVQFADKLTNADVLPLDALRLLPACIYMDAPDLFAPGTDGCFLYRKTPQRSGVPVVFQVVFRGRGGNSFFPGQFIASSELPLEHCLAPCDDLAEIYLAAAAHPIDAAKKVLLNQFHLPASVSGDLKGIVLRVAQMALYIVSAKADVRGGQQAPADRKRSIHSTTARSTDLKPIPEVPDTEDFPPLLFEIGFEAGKKLREAVEPESTGSSAPKRSHIRRAHWHRYWIRTESGEKILVPRWIDAVLVGGDVSDPVE